MTPGGRKQIKELIDRLPAGACLALRERCNRRAHEVLRQRDPGASRPSDGKPDAQASSVFGKTKGGANKRASVATARQSAVDAFEGALGDGAELGILMLDYLHLLGLTKQHRWTHKTRVPQEVFPPFEPELTDGSEAEVVLQFVVPPTVAVEELTGNLVKLLEIADEHYRSHGGSGLIVSQTMIRERVQSPVPAGD